MICVHFRDQERDVRVHPVVARVAHDDVARPGERRLDVARNRRIQSGEHELRRVRRSRLIHLHLRDIRGERHRKSPGTGVAIRLARGSFARAEPTHLEPGMVREQRNELLADHAGRAEDSYFDRHRFFPLCPL